MSAPVHTQAVQAFLPMKPLLAFLFSPTSDTHAQPMFGNNNNNAALDSSVGITTSYGLDDQGIESRWGRDFPYPDPEAHPTSYTMGTGTFLGVKRPGRGVDPHPNYCRGYRKSRAIPLLSRWVFVTWSSVNLTFIIIIIIIIIWDDALSQQDNGLSQSRHDYTRQRIQKMK